MNFFEIKNNSINYNNVEMQKIKEITFEDKEYIEFVNTKERLFILMEKVADDVCIDINNKELESKLKEEYMIKVDSIV